MTRHTISILFTAALGITTCMSAFAAPDNAGGTPPKSDVPRDKESRPSDYFVATHVLHKLVIDPKGRRIGHVEDLALGRSGGQMYAIVTLESHLNVGTGAIAIPWRTFYLDEDTDMIFLDASEKRIADAPRIDLAAWPLNAAIALSKTELYFKEHMDKSGELTSGPGASHATMTTPARPQMDIFFNLDISQDGALSKSEAVVNPDIGRDFDNYDRNHDGKLDRSEFTAYLDWLEHPSAK